MLSLGRDGIGSLAAERPCRPRRDELRWCHGHEHGLRATPQLDDGHPEARVGVHALQDHAHAGCDLPGPRRRPIRPAWSDPPRRRPLARRAGQVLHPPPRVGPGRSAAFRGEPAPVRVARPRRAGRTCRPHVVAAGYIEDGYSRYATSDLWRVPFRTCSVLRNHPLSHFCPMGHAPGTNRTCGLPLRRRSLYPLSYEGAGRA